MFDGRYVFHGAMGGEANPWRRRKGKWTFPSKFGGALDVEEK